MSDPSSQPNFSLDGVTQPQTPAPSQPVVPSAPSPPQPTQQQQPEPVLSQYAQDLLNEIPETERASFQQYVQKWDAGVERRVRQLQTNYAPFNDFLDQGYDPEELKTAAQLYDMLNTDPERAIQVLSNAYGQGQLTPQQQPQSTQQQQQQQQTAQLPPELQQQMTQMNQFMQQMALQNQNQQRQAEQEAQDRALDDYMTLLRQEKGDFDESYVLTKMAAGFDGAQAVDEYNRITRQGLPNNPGVGNGVNGTVAQAPPVLHGGSAGTGTRPVHEYSRQERKDLVAQILQTANQQGN